MPDNCSQRSPSPLATAIRNIRKRAGLSQHAFARMLGCSHITVSRYEDGKSQPAILRVRSLLDMNPPQMETEVLLTYLSSVGAIVPVVSLKDEGVDNGHVNF